MAFLAHVPVRELSTSPSACMLVPKSEVTLRVSRTLSIVLAVLYVTPLFGVNFCVFYQAALISSIVATTTQLWQRWPSVDGLSTLLLDDSFHYLLHSVLFLTASPRAFVLVPLTLFFVLHCSAGLLKLFERNGPTSTCGVIFSFTRSQQQTIRVCVALSEMVLLFVFGVTFFEGLNLRSVWNLMLLQMYYSLLRRRYASEINAFAICGTPTMAFLAHIPMSELSCSSSMLGLVATYILKNEVTVLVSRALSVLFAVLYMSPLFGVNSYLPYQAALMSSIVTSASLLWQRWPSLNQPGQNKIDVLSKLLLEDSCHYLLYSILFLTASPIALVLLSVLLFSVLHCSSATLKLLDKIGRTSSSGVDTFISFMESQQQNILVSVAISEVSLLFILPFFEGFSLWSLLLMLIYYYLLRHRYAAEVNPFAVKKLNARQIDYTKLKQSSKKYESDIFKFLAKDFAVVHFWKPKVWICCDFRFARFQVGHLALTLPDGTHISLWPDGKKELKEDIELEQRVPDEFILIPADKVQQEELSKFYTLYSCNLPKHCLLPSKVKLWWEKYASDKYNILKNNCAHTVRKALLEGDFETEKLDWVPVAAEVKTFIKYYEFSFNDIPAEKVVNFAAILAERMCILDVEELDLMTILPHIGSISEIQSFDASVFIELFKLATRMMQKASPKARRQFNDDVLKSVFESGMFNYISFRCRRLGIDGLKPLNLCFSIIRLVCNDVLLYDFAESEVLPLSIDVILKLTRDMHQGEVMSLARAVAQRMKIFSAQERKALLVEIRNFVRACIPTTSVDLMPVPSCVFKHVHERVEDINNHQISRQ